MVSAYELHHGDCLAIMPTLEAGSVQTCVTSPPYFGLRDYGVPPTDWPAVEYAPMAGLPALVIPPMTCCLGLEPTVEAYIGHLVLIFRGVRDALRDDGTCWLNLGDSYAGSGKGPEGNLNKGATFRHLEAQTGGHIPAGLKPKDLIGVPWRAAFALQADGWYLRQDIIWAKPNPMPESVTDRCTKAHEYIFLLAKSARYWYDHEAVKEEGAGRRDLGKMTSPARLDQGGPWSNDKGERDEATRNKRSVWTVSTKPYAAAHFATFNPELIEPCILAGSPPAGKRCDCDEIILTPTGTGAIDNPTMTTGRAGMNRPRREGEGSRPITRREQRHEAHEMKHSPYRAEMESICGPAFAHYIRTDASGARPLPPSVRECFVRRGWITPAPPCTHPIEPAGLVLDIFAGTSATGEAALRNGRRYIGIEASAFNVQLSHDRLAPIARELRGEFHPRVDEGAALHELPLFAEANP